MCDDRVRSELADDLPTIFSSDAFAIEIARRALPNWVGFEGADIAPVKVRENAVMRIARKAGGVFALRVHRSGYHSDAVLQSEYTWSASLRSSGILTPQLVPTRLGFSFASLTHAGARYQIDLFEWVEASHPSIALGGQGALTSDIVDQYRQIGATMARMHALAQLWQPPGDFVRHSWDAKALLGERPLWGRFWEFAGLSVPQRDLMIMLRDQARPVLDRLSLHSAHFGMIHADLMPDNVIFANEGLYVIDFDDAGLGWYVFDIAVSLFSFSGHADYAVIKEAFLSGYCDHRALLDEELDDLPMFLACRGAALLGWLHTRRQREAASRSPWLVELACRNAKNWLDGRR